MEGDRELVERCLAGDPEGIRDFIGQFQGIVFGLCLRHLAHRQDAEDVAQESLVRAVRHLAKWDPARPLRPWVLMIAVNRCRTHATKRQTLPVASEFLGESIADHRRTAVVDLAEELEWALGRLRDEYRETFLLFHQQDLSVREVAEMMNCPEGTVKVWLFRARRELASLLKERGVVTESGHELFRV